jgi:hypothetical protein
VHGGQAVTYSQKSPRYTDTPDHPSQIQDEQEESILAKSSQGKGAQPIALTQAEEVTAEQKFAAFYLRQTTQEFADDLDKLRTASDFNDRSVELLVDSLQKGTACFAKSDRVRIGRAGAET